MVTHAAGPSSPLDSNAPQNTQALSLSSIIGGVTSAGNQHYIIQQAGPLPPTFMASIDGYTIAPGNPSNFNYQLNVQVQAADSGPTPPSPPNHHGDSSPQGITVTGNANFNINAQTSDGNTIHVSANAQINDMIAAVCLPSGSISGTCASTDTSAVPAYFLGIANLHITITTPPAPPTAPTPRAPPNQPTPPTPPTPPINIQVPMMFESAYLNPFGAPLVIVSQDLLMGSSPIIMIVTTYQHATIDWSNVQTGGYIMGALGQTGFSGIFVQISHEHEDLFAGTARDSGTMTFSNVISTSGTPLNTLDVSGPYKGNSTIPTASSYACTNTGLSGTPIGVGNCMNTDCSASIGFPMSTGVTGVCTNTGFESSGTFNGKTQGSQITVDYVIPWSIPAFVFIGSSTFGLVTTH